MWTIVHKIVEYVKENGLGCGKKVVNAKEYDNLCILMLVFSWLDLFYMYIVN